MGNPNLLVPHYIGMVVYRLKSRFDSVLGDSEWTLEVGVTSTSTNRLDKQYPLNYEGCHFLAPMLKLGEA